MRTRSAITLMIALAATGCREGTGGHYDPDTGVDARDGAADDEALVDGGDGDVDADLGSALECEAAVGNGSLSGSVQGTTLSASHAAGVEIHLLGMVGYSVGFGSEAGTCSALAPTVDTMPLALFVCDTAPGTYEIGSDCLEGSGAAFANAVKIPGEGDDISASSGSITIEAFDPACGGAVTGSFAAEFDGEPVSGEFDAVGCCLLDL
jgi:hypothetical protein